ncbi:hypothetical protein ACGTRS_24625 [Burkholderia semiarida]|uniref:Fis family transcriptional regulator n=1 Tax=Burkholderia semiarida TaxID=2843303 RepID=A0ABW7LA66_9BURK
MQGMRIAKYVQDLAVRLRKATLERDFDLMRLLDQEVHLVVTQLAGREFSDEARGALVLLRATHQAAVDMIEAELQALSTEMTRASDRRPGWQAYARQADEPPLR